MKQVFEPINALVFVVLVLMIVSGKYMYSLPYLLWDMMDERKVKEAKTALRDNRRVKRDHMRRSSRHINAGALSARSPAPGQRIPTTVARARWQTSGSLRSWRP